MKILIIIPVLIFSILLGVSSFSADFEKGIDAYNKGDFATALKEWKPLAEQGDAKAQYQLSFLYYHGDGVPPDYDKAIFWLNKSSQQKYYPAQELLAHLCK